MANKAAILLPLFLILIFPVSFSQPHFPHVICGFVFYDGTPAMEANVTVTDERTGEMLYNITNKFCYMGKNIRKVQFNQH